MSDLEAAATERKQLIRDRVDWLTTTMKEKCNEPGYWVIARDTRDPNIPVVVTMFTLSASATMVPSTKSITAAEVFMEDYPGFYELCFRNKMDLVWDKACDLDKWNMRSVASTLLQAIFCDSAGLTELVYPDNTELPPEMRQKIKTGNLVGSTCSLLTNTVFAASAFATGFDDDNVIKNLTINPSSLETNFIPILQQKASCLHMGASTNKIMVLDIQKGRGMSTTVYDTTYEVKLRGSYEMKLRTSYAQSFVTDQDFADWYGDDDGTAGQGRYERA